MFYSIMSADNSGRYPNGQYGRWGWDWRLHNHYACLVCRTHRVEAGGGNGNCHVCGYPLCTIGTMPRKRHAAEWRRLRNNVAKPMRRENFAEARQRALQQCRPGRPAPSIRQVQRLLLPLRPGEQRALPNPLTWK